MKFEHLNHEGKMNKQDEYYQHRRLSERDNYPMTQPTHKLEASFLRMKPEKELPESSEEEILEEIVKKHEEKDTINPIHFFNYKGANVKIGEMKSLGKFIYAVNFSGHDRNGWFIHSDVEENIKNIIREAEELIQEVEEQK